MQTQPDDPSTVEPMTWPESGTNAVPYDPDEGGVMPVLPAGTYRVVDGRLFRVIDDAPPIAYRHLEAERDRYKAALQRIATGPWKQYNEYGQEIQTGLHSTDLVTIAREALDQPHRTQGQQ